MREIKGKRILNASMTSDGARQVLGPQRSGTKPTHRNPPNAQLAIATAAARGGAAVRPMGRSIDQRTTLKGSENPRPLSVLIIPDKFKGTLSSRAAAEAIAKG